MGLLNMIIRFVERIITFIIGADDKKLYGLDHAILHMEAPPKNMWMNMGYWKVCTATSIYTIVNDFAETKIISIRDPSLRPARRY